MLRAILAMLLLSGGAALVRLSTSHALFVGHDSGLRMVGHLPARELAQIRRLVYRESFPHMSTHFVRDIRAWYAARRSRGSEHISEILAQPDGTVAVTVNVWGPDPLVRGWTDWQDRLYILRKGSKGWRVITTWDYEHCRG
jgi:hypothetical protein